MVCGARGCRIAVSMWRRIAGVVMNYRFRRPALVFLLALSFLLGIALAHGGVIVDSSWWWCAALGVLVTIKKQRVWCAVWIIALGLSLGWWRGGLYAQHLVQFEALQGHKITLVGRATEDAVYDRNKQLTFDLINPRVAETGEQLTGKVAVSGFGVNAVFANDQVQAHGKIRLARGSYQARMSFSQMDVLAHHPTVITEARSRFAAGMQSALPEPVASFAMGLLIGQRNTLPADVSQMLLMVGLTHIIAVSGYNLTVLLRASRRLLGKVSKRQSTLLALGLIAIFLLFAGSSASIVRAAIVSVLSIAAAYYGRSFKPLVLILLAAAITAWANPYYVWTDVSWYLSFLAFFGVMVLEPMVMQCLPKRLHESLVANVALESLCAEIMTLPYVLHIFGQMSFIGLVSNVMVVALIPLAMLLALMAGLAGMLIPAVAGWFAWPALLLMTYMLDIATLLSRIPHIFVQNLGFSLKQLMALYGITAAVCLLLYRRSKLKYATLTDRTEAARLENPTHDILGGLK